MALQALKQLIKRLCAQHWPPRPAQTGTQVFKILVIGPFGSGKRQYIATVGELMPPGEVAVTFGRLIINNTAALYFFECPGARRFDTVLAFCQTGVLGMVLVIDCAWPETFREAAEIMGFLQREQLAPFVVVANHYPQPRRACYVEELRLITRYYTATELVVGNAQEPPSAYGALRQLLALASATPAAVAAPEDYQALVQLVATHATTPGGEPLAPTPIFEIVVVGDFQAGKAQYIKAVTEVVSGAGLLGRLTLTQTAALQLVKWPVSFAPKFLENRLLGAVLVIDCARPKSFRYATRVMNFFRCTQRVPLVVVANHYPQPYQTCHLDELRQIVRGYMATTLGVGNATDRRHAYQVLGELLACAHQTPAALAAPAEYQVLVRLVEAHANGQ